MVWTEWKIVRALRRGEVIDFMIPTCDAYPYDGGECVKVCEA